MRRVGDLPDQPNATPCVGSFNRQGFSHREADGKSLLDEAVRRFAQWLLALLNRSCIRLSMAEGPMSQVF
jgi:hypothetical protein